jgi:signal transduction histidine kinase
VIPLGVKASGHELRAYTDDARAVARSAAAVAEEQLADHRPSPEMSSVLAAARRDGDTLVVRDVRGAIVAAVGSPATVPPGLIDEAIGATQLETDVSGGYVSVALPVRDDSVVGSVALARPLGPLDNRVRELWLSLALIALAALAASAVLALALARWVSRPLAELDASARRLGTGDLAARAAAGSGPPELRRLAISFNSMAARLETLVHGHRAVVADVSHQLRTPLAALRLRLDLLAQDADPVTAAQLAGALEEFGRLSRLVDGMLAVASAENAVPQPVAVDVCDVIRERVAAWQPVAADREVWLGARVSGRLWAAIGAGHLEQILDNLLANALDATSMDDTVTVSAEVAGAGSAPVADAVAAAGHADGGVRVVVADDGPGMSPADRDRAFGRFTTSSPGGTGLGLAIVHRLASSNGGTATLAETTGGGLSVILEFRCAPPGQLGDGETARPPAASALVRPHEGADIDTPAG